MPAAPTKDSYKYDAVVFVDVGPTELCCYVLRRSDKLGYRLHRLNIPGHEQKDRRDLMQEGKVSRIGRIALVSWKQDGPNSAPSRCSQ